MWKTKIKNYSAWELHDLFYIRIVLYVYDIGVRKNNDLEEEIKLVKCSRASLQRAMFFSVERNSFCEEL